MFGVIFGWALMSYQLVSNSVIAALVANFGAVTPTTLPDVVVRLAVTLALFLAHEFSYWFDHYLMHRVPILWEFHKVHHSATILTPLTGVFEPIRRAGAHVGALLPRSAPRATGAQRVPVEARSSQ